ncbi:unnamed protein product [Onchocerca flexuosa]|uniref:Uncharacterized protein n=1 Tax=Onchocerca flexuosa TaxID=387005 RepID=A0A183I5A5_9BILA|nr:unnamed protein product [Onchocerca flexuosa]
MSPHQLLKKMNITKLTKFVSSLMAFTTDLDDSEDLDKNIEGIEIPGMNASVSTDIEQFNTSVIHASIYPSMNAEVPESIHPSMKCKSTITRTGKNILEIFKLNFNL